MAECVENLRQLRVVKEMGVDFIQGALVGMPRPFYGAYYPETAYRVACRAEPFSTYNLRAITKSNLATTPPSLLWLAPLLEYGSTANEKNKRAIENNGY